MTFDLAAYLGRIALSRPPVTDAGLRSLQEAHLSAIAFESLDPLTGRIPDLNPDALQGKLVAGGRGGYCFEQNGLFAMALASLGFDARPIMARVRNGAARGGARSHLAHIVRLDGRDWLADVGFGGGGTRWPVPLECHRLDYQPGEVFRIKHDEETGEMVLQRLEGGDWYNLYGFEDAPVQRIDVEAANYLCATWAKMPFSSNMMLHRLTPDGRIGVFNTRVKTMRDGVKREYELRDAAMLSRLLREDLSLSIADEDIALVADKLGLSSDADALSPA